jgi:sterol desaturase/sphingolipid hydroxylase (fatty acid hydroxylase superfamily)
MEALRSLDLRLLAYAVQILRLCIWLVLLAAIFTPLERLFALHPKNIFRKAIVTDLGYYFLSSLVPSILLSVPLAFVAWAVHRFIPIGFTSAIAAWPIALRIAASMVVGEIGFYWGHRWSHELPLLWRFHAIHHSAEHLDFLVNTRAHPVDMVFTRLCQLTPMYVLGLASPIGRSGSLIPILVILAGTIWGFFIHANIRWRFGPLEWLVSTPAFHHWHHTNDGPAYINKNYAPLLPFIDKLFGTLYLPKDRQPASYGIDQSMPPTLFGQLMEPFLLWRKAPSPTLNQVDPIHTADQGSTAVPSTQKLDTPALTETER